MYVNSKVLLVEGEPAHSYGWSHCGTRRGLTILKEVYWPRVHCSCKLDEIQFRHARSGSKRHSHSMKSGSSSRDRHVYEHILITFLSSTVAIVNKGPLKSAFNESAVKTQRAVNSQTARMRRMVCGFAIHVQLSQVYSHIRVSNWSDVLEPNCLQRLSAGNNSREMRTSHGVHIAKDDQRRMGVTIHLSNPKY